jgi:DNA-binding transcriptional LysR family regulator
MIDFKTLETFIWVANLRSFRRAAEKLNTTQPAVSTRIAQLESFLGLRLLERDRRSVAPTPNGQEFLVHAERLLRLRGEMIEAVGDRSTVRGIVRLGVSESIVHTWLPTLMKRVNEAYPHLELEIEVDVSPKLLDSLVARDLDLAFLVGPVGNPNVHSRPLCSFPLAFVACDTIPIPRTPMTLERIAERPLITFARNTRPHKALRELLAEKGLRATIHASASLEAVVRMALDGIGIAVIPPAIIEKKVEAREKLRLLHTTIRLPDLDYVVGWPAAPENFAAQKVADIALQVAGNTPGARRAKIKRAKNERAKNKPLKSPPVKNAPVKRAAE